MVFIGNCKELGNAQSTCCDVVMNPIHGMNMSLIVGDFMEISHGYCLYYLFGNHCVVKHF